MCHLSDRARHTRAVHEFLVAEELLMPVTIGVDFLSRHSVIFYRLQLPNGTHSHSNPHESRHHETTIQVLAILSVQLLSQKVTQLKSVQRRSLGT